MAYVNLPYEIITGHRRDSRLLWSPSEKILYFRRKVANGKEDWGCYQEMLRKTDASVIPCSSRVLVDPAKSLCTPKQICHSYHQNHERLYKDLVSRNNIVDSCVNLRNDLAGLSAEVPVADIFTREMAS